MAKGNLNFSGEEVDKFLGAQHGQEFVFEVRGQFANIWRDELGNLQTSFTVTKISEANAVNETKDFLVGLTKRS